MTENEKPKRIQRKRVKGFRLQDASSNPNGVVYVGRPSRWGNPYKLGAEYRNPFEPVWSKDAKFEVTPDNCLDLFLLYAQGMLSMKPRWLEPLRGKDLACWCPLSSPCHASILLRLANS